MDRHLVQALDIQGLRAVFLRHTRRAFAGLTELPVRPQILDIGCGDGAVTLELARLSSGEILGIDVDDEALVQLLQQIERENLGHRVQARRCSLLADELPHLRFNLLWAEGVLHLLDAERSLEVCGQLLGAGGYLVCCDTVQWQEANQERFRQAGFKIVTRHPWPARSWWTEFYSLLEPRILRLREQPGATGDHELSHFEAEVAMIREDPEKFDCAHLVCQKRA